MAETILVVDDDEKIRKLLRNCFEPEGYEVFEAESNCQIDTVLAQQNVDLITLDLNLGTENGLTIATTLRAKCNIPIIIVTGKGDVIDKVVGLEMGADDYISKPFHVREVLARVRTVLRRSSERPHVQKLIDEETHKQQQHKIYAFDDWRVDAATYDLKNPDGELIELTTADFKLLMVLIQRARQVLSRDQIMDHLNGNDWAPYDRTIDNQIARLRKKIEEDPAKPKMIKTVRGVGYTFVADVSLVEAQP